MIIFVDREDTRPLLSSHDSASNQTVKCAGGGGRKCTNYSALCCFCSQKICQSLRSIPWILLHELEVAQRMRKIPGHASTSWWLTTIPKLLQTFVSSLLVVYLINVLLLTSNHNSVNTLGPCPANTWPCNDGIQCVNITLRCNSVLDCSDGSDEGAICS